MKMNVGTRIIFSVYVAAVIILCAFVLGTLFGLIPLPHITGIVQTISLGSFWYKFLYAAILIAMIAIGAMLLFFGIRKADPKTAKIAMFENGSVVMTVSAIEELVERYMREVKSIKGLKTKVISYDDYIDINVEISVLPGTDIPELTKELQFGLVVAIQKQTGITVKQTKIVVISLNDQIKSKPA